jgi:hypothetical protein
MSAPVIFAEMMWRLASYTASAASPAGLFILDVSVNLVKAGSGIFQVWISLSPYARFLW